MSGHTPWAEVKRTKQLATLRTLAEAALLPGLSAEDRGDLMADFYAAADPTTILALLDDLDMDAELLRQSSLALDLMRVERDALRAALEGLVALAEGEWGERSLMPDIVAARAALEERP